MFLQRLLLDTSSLRYLRTFLDWLLDWILGTMVTIACCLLTLLDIFSCNDGCTDSFIQCITDTILVYWRVGGHRRTNLLLDRETFLLCHWFLERMALLTLYTLILTKLTWNGVGGRVKEGDGGFVGELVVLRGQGRKVDLRLNY